jgi:RHS repeat-associated protein
MSVMRSLSATVCAVGLVGSIAAAIPPPYHYNGTIWSPSGLPSVHSVSGHSLPGGASPGAPQVKEPGGHPAVEFRPQPAAWPAAGTGTAQLTQQPGPLPASSTAMPATQAGALPVWVSPATAPFSAGKASGTAQATTLPAPASVKVTLAGHTSAAAAGVTGLVMTLTRTDQAAGAASVMVRLSYAGIAGNYGGGWASRLRLVQLPACALTTPGQPACRTPLPLASSNDGAAQTVSATVPMPAQAQQGQVVLAATASPAGPEGNYTATSLKPSGTWAVQDGDFSYSYPISVPPSLGGAAPTVALTYDSQSIDSETSGQNTQASWIGDGWDYSPGFIERSYKQCSNDGIANSGDECWGGYNAMLSLNGHSGVLVRDDGTAHAWHLQNDDGTQVQLLTGAPNNLWNGEYWLVTTADGTKYYFGLNHLPGGSGTDPAANSAWGVPVYSPGTSDPCNGNTWCQMGWRWNLDYVVDPHGNLRTYNYSTETNYYERGGGQNNGTGTLTSYVRGGYLNTISYGYRLTDAISGAKPAAEISFSTKQRCVTSTSYTCGSDGPTSTTASNWPDVPFDQNCGSSGSCTNYAPSFWSTMRLDSITTEVQAGGSPKNVDTYQLNQTYPDAGGASQPVMFLNSITRTGNDGTAISLPAVTFTPTEIDNRVDGLVPAAPPLYRPRISTVATDAGAGISVLYNAPACSRVNKTMPASADSNTMPCFPVYWTPPGESSPIQDWFTKSLVGQVTVADETKIGSPVQVTSYQYLGGAAWHQDISPLTNDTYRTWDQFRGYAQIITTTGAAPDPVTETETTYLRGMNGDAKSGGGTTSVSVADTVGDTVTDDNWLAGQVLETDTYTASGGSMVAKSVNGPWTSRTTATQAMPGSLPTLTAQMPQTERTRQFGLLANGSWRTSETGTTYNAADQVVQTDDKGDGSASDPETCTSTSYAASSANPMMLSYPDEVKQVTGPCGTAATASTTVSDTRTFYDGSGTLSNLGSFGTIPGPGNATGSQVISGYDLNGNPVYQPKAAATFDAYGRPLTATDAKGNVTSTAYTPATGALPTQTTLTNPEGWTTQTALDQLRQLPVQVTDPNGRVTSETYDALGRLTAVWKPSRSQAANQSPNLTFGYSETGTTPPTVTTSTLRENGSYSTDVKIYDGLLQLRQEQTTTANNSAGRLISDTFHDSHGWVVKASAPYYDDTTPPDTTVFVADDSQVPSQTVTQYDGQGRVTASQFYSLATLQWQTTTAYPGVDETDVTPPAGGTATTTFTNGRGEKTATWAYTTATPTRKASDAVVTSYTYTPAGQPASITDNAGNKWSYVYNLLGQKISQTDPDAGTTTYGYDANGNLTSTTDARNQTLGYTYDALNRKTGEYAGSVTAANQLAGWTYDTLEKGQLTSSTAYSGGASGSAYTEAVTGYSTDYLPTGTSITIPAAEGALAGSYTTTNTYTPTIGLLNSTAYSGDGGLPAETVSYSYDLQGLLNAFGGQTAYLDQTSYTPFGQMQRTTTGLYGKQLVTTASYDQGTSRLLQTTTNLQTLSSAADITNYTYNQAGSLTSVSDSQNNGQNDLQCYGYDNLQRLTQAWTDTGGTSTAPGPSVSGIGGCTTITPSQSSIGGPAPYWQSYGYDPLGDRTSETQHQTGGDITQTLSYPGNGTAPASQPNQVSSVTTSGPGVSSTAAYSYDPAGDTKGRSGSSALSFGYDQLGRTSSVTSGGGTSGYLYDADGNLLIQRDPGRTTLYLDGGTEELTLAGGTVTGQRYYTQPDGTTIVRSSSGTLSYEVANRQHTAMESVDATSLAITRRYFDPYGNPRGAVPGSWPDQHAFVGKPADQNTSLDLLGARQYDPATGRFLQVDPVLEAGDPRQMGGYTYAADNPVNASDPAGLRACIDTCGSATDVHEDQPTSAYMAQQQQGFWQQLQDTAENQALDSCASSHCYQHTIQLFSRPAWADAQATRMANQLADIAQAQQTQAAAGESGGCRGFLGCAWHYAKKAVSYAADQTGITDGWHCITSPTLSGCFNAAIKLGLTGFTIASMGAGAEADVGVSAMMGGGRGIFGSGVSAEATAMSGAKEVAGKAALSGWRKACAVVGMVCELVTGGGAVGADKPVQDVGEYAVQQTFNADTDKLEPWEDPLEGQHIPVANPPSGSGPDPLDPTSIPPYLPGY